MDGGPGPSGESRISRMMAAMNIEDSDQNSTYYRISSRQQRWNQQAESSLPSVIKNAVKTYDYTLKFLLVGDSDVGKNEILNMLGDPSNETDEEESLYGSPGVIYKSTVILLDGKQIRLQVWDTSGQGRFSTIIRSYSRGAQGILLVYDITNKWSFNGLNRWLQEVEEHAPGVPKILLGNRLHLAFNRQVSESAAECYAYKHNMSFFEVSPLCDFNIKESFTELARIVLQRHGMESLWKNSTVLSLQELCCRAIVRQTTTYGIERLPLPSALKKSLKSYSTHTSSTAGGLTIKPCFKIYEHIARDKEKDNTLKRKAKNFFACDAHSSSLPSTLRPTSRSSTGRPLELPAPSAGHPQTHHRRLTPRSHHCVIS